MEEISNSGVMHYRTFRLDGRTTSESLGRWSRRTLLQVSNSSWQTQRRTLRKSFWHFLRAKKRDGKIDYMEGVSHGSIYLASM
jgi:hypothetical protein